MKIITTKPFNHKHICLKINVMKNPVKMALQIRNIKEYLYKKYSFKIRDIEIGTVNTDFFDKKITIKLIQNNNGMVW